MEILGFQRTVYWSGRIPVVRDAFGAGAVTVNATAVVLGDVHDLRGFDLAKIGLHYVITGSAPDVKIEMLQSALTGEATFIANAGTGELVTSATASATADLTVKRLPYLRARVTGNGGNGADTTVRLLICALS
jgi:hypothetical protein